MVTMRSPALMLPTGIEHDRRTSPLMCTEQAPHCATPQPYLVPVRPACSRIAHSRGVSASTWRSRTLPLILSFMEFSWKWVEEFLARGEIGLLHEHLACLCRLDERC